jgi:hypothetical protein
VAQILFYLRVAALAVAGTLLTPAFGFTQTAKAAAQNDWQKIVEAAKQEGKVVISMPPSAELRKGIEDAFTTKYGIVLELVPARGANLIGRIADEHRTGVHYFDLHIGGTESIVKGLLAENILDPVEPLFVLPEVKDPKNWWGWLYLDGQCQAFHLQLCRLPDGEPLVQHECGEAGRVSLF